MVKNIVLRMCLGCNQMKPKKELIRIVKTKENTTIIDFTGKQLGRGAYICKNILCLKNIKKTNKLQKSLRIHLSDTIYNELEVELEKNNGT